MEEGHWAEDQVSQSPGAAVQATWPWLDTSGSAALEPGAVIRCIFCHVPLALQSPARAQSQPGSGKRWDSSPGVEGVVGRSPVASTHHHPGRR